MVDEVRSLWPNFGHDMVFNIYERSTVNMTVFRPLLGFKKKNNMEKALFHLFKGKCDIAATFILQISEKISSLNLANADYRISDTYGKTHDFAKKNYFFYISYYFNPNKTDWPSQNLKKKFATLVYLTHFEVYFSDRISTAVLKLK